MNQVSNVFTKQGIISLVIAWGHLCVQSGLPKQKQLEQREERQLDRSNNLLSDEASSATEAIFSPPPLPAVIFEVSESCLLFLNF